MKAFTDWSLLSRLAWQVRDAAFVIGNTKVGAACVSASGHTFGGCNVEHRYRCHDVHAEVNAISTMIAAGQRELHAILVASERDYFTPCGSCMDWIFQFGGQTCLVAFQRNPLEEPTVFSAHELMPHYPR